MLHSYVWRATSHSKQILATCRFLSVSNSAHTLFTVSEISQKGLDLKKKGNKSCSKQTSVSSLSLPVLKSLSTMSSTKRALECVNSPPPKYRLLHTEPDSNIKHDTEVAMETSDSAINGSGLSQQLTEDKQTKIIPVGVSCSDETTLEAPSSEVTSVESLSTQLEPASTENIGPSSTADEVSEAADTEEVVKTEANAKEKPVKSYGKLLAYAKIDERTAKSKQAVRNLNVLVSEADERSKFLISEENSFKGSARVIHPGAPALPVHPNPVDEVEEDDVAGGLIPDKRKKKMYAIFLSYSGKGYLGLQNNFGFETIEGELLKAMQATKLLTENECVRLQSVNFQRAARTDKGVSAARQLLSAKLPISEGEEERYISELNALLPAQIRLMDLRRATRSFNSKNWCDYRTYSYLTPSYAFAPLEELTNNEYRISDDVLATLRKLLGTYVGTHNFHNFTIRKKPTERNARRFIHSVEACDPFIRDEVEWIHIKIRGQSFMMHQIRKMVGLVISICRGLTAESVLVESFTHAKVETPKAPALGLVLEQPHYDIYNKRFGEDGQHQPLEWSAMEDKVEAFRRDFIDKEIIQTELSEHSMLEFLRILHMYSFSPEDEEGTGVGRAYNKLVNSREEGSDDSNTAAPSTQEGNEGQTQPPPAPATAAGDGAAAVVIVGDAGANCAAGSVAASAAAAAAGDGEAATIANGCGAVDPLVEAVDSTEQEAVIVKAGAGSLGEVGQQS